MALKDIVNTLRQEEQQLLKQLSNVRSAMTALGSNLTYIATGRGKPVRIGRGRPAASNDNQHAQPPIRKRRKLSKDARNAISKAQKLRWAKQKAGATK